MKLGICQIKVTSNKENNLLEAENMIEHLVKNNVNLIILPECFNSPYGINYFREYSQNFRSKKKR